MDLKHEIGDLELHIEELVLHGFPAADRFEIGEAVERELLRLMTEGAFRGLPARAGLTEQLDAGRFRVATGARPRTVGAQIAQTVFAGLPQTGKRGVRR